MWHGGGEFGQRSSDGGGNYSNKDQAIDKLDWSAGVDARDEGRGYAEPGVCEGKAETKNGPHAEAFSKFRDMAYLGRFWTARQFQIRGSFAWLLPLDGTYPSFEDLPERHR